MAKLAVERMIKRLQAVEERRSPPKRVARIVISQGEDTDLAMAKWRAEHPGEDPDLVIWRVVVSGVSRPDEGMPDPER
jgi:hypothetical protein